MAFAIAAGAFGSAFQHGYNTGVLNAPQKLITDWIGVCDNSTTTSADPNDVSDAGSGDENCKSEATVVLIWSWIVAAFCVGGMIGGTVVGYVSSK